MKSINVHGLFVDEALDKIKSFIKANPNEDVIEVIHGFNHGYKIKNAINERGRSLDPRVSQIVPSLINGGTTLIYLKIKR